MALNLTDVLQELEATRAKTAQELADADAIIAIVKQRMNGTPVKAAPKNGNAKPVAKANGSRKQLTADQIATMKVQYESGNNADQIGKRFGISAAGVIYHAKVKKWKRPNRPKPGAVALPASTAPSFIEPVKLAGGVRCPDCKSMTETDPCQFCGKKLPRKW